jgi:large-conductance mechanosensitive channel
MRTTLLQIDPTQGATKLLDYGTLGVMAFLLIAVVVYLERQRSKREKETDARFAALETEFKSKQKEHEDFVKGALADSTNVMRNCVELLQEVKQFLKNKNSQ